MSLLPRLVVIVPLVLSIIGMVLSALALFAGHQKGFMEEYAIARLNVSMIGQDLFSKDSDKEEEDDDGHGGWLGNIKDKFDDVKDSAKDELNDLVGDAADDVANALGISDWYSIHVMNACEGDFKPNATASSTSLNITNCTETSAGYRFNLTELLDKEMSVGPLDFNLKDLDWPDEIQKQLDKLNDALMGLFILYVLGMGLSGVAILGCGTSAALPERKSVSLGNLIAAALAAGSLAIGSILITVAVTKGVDEINDKGEKVGVSVSRGTRFLAISWVATGVMLSATVFWGVRFCLDKRRLRSVKSWN